MHKDLKLCQFYRKHPWNQKLYKLTNYNVTPNGVFLKCNIMTSIHHQTIRIEYILLKIASILSLSPLFMSPKHNANATIKGSYNMQRFLILEVHSSNFLYIDVVSLRLLMPTYHRLEVRKLLGVHLLSL
jgi:hypothetical protein